VELHAGRGNIHNTWLHSAFICTLHNTWLLICPGNPGDLTITAPRAFARIKLHQVQPSNGKACATEYKHTGRQGCSIQEEECQDCYKHSNTKHLAKNPRLLVPEEQREQSKCRVHRRSMKTNTIEVVQQECHTNFLLITWMIHLSNIL
jgi:hypothetical protein